MASDDQQELLLDEAGEHADASACDGDALVAARGRTHFRKVAVVCVVLGVACAATFSLDSSTSRVSLWDLISYAAYVETPDDPCTCWRRVIDQPNEYATAEEVERGEIEDIPDSCNGMCVSQGYGKCRGGVNVNGDEKTAATPEDCKNICLTNPPPGRNGKPIETCVAVESVIKNGGETAASCEFYRRYPLTSQKGRKGAKHRCWLRVGYPGTTDPGTTSEEPPLTSEAPTEDPGTTSEEPPLTSEAPTEDPGTTSEEPPPTTTPDLGCLCSDGYDCNGFCLIGDFECDLGQKLYEPESAEDLEDCKAKCARSVDCRSFQYNWFSKQCTSIEEWVEDVDSATEMSQCWRRTLPVIKTCKCDENPDKNECFDLCWHGEGACRTADNGTGTYTRKRYGIDPLSDVPGPTSKPEDCKKYCDEDSACVAFEFSPIMEGIGAASKEYSECEVHTVKIVAVDASVVTGAACWSKLSSLTGP